MTTNQLVAKNVSLCFPNRMQALRNVGIEIAAGEIVGLVGESGSGKSTLGRVIVGLQQSYTGKVTFDGIELGAKRTRKQRCAIQMVFQDPYASLDPRMSIWQLLEELMIVHRIGNGRDDRRHRCETLLGRVQLPVAMLDTRPTRMSGGQRQRVAIARALAVQPRFLVADEPTAALDVSVQAGIINLFASLRKDMQLSQLFISHNLAVVRSLCDRVAVIYRGQIVEVASTDEIFNAPRHAYTQQLLAAAPDLP